MGRQWNGAIRGSPIIPMGRRWNGAIRGSANMITLFLWPHTPRAADGTGLSAALHLISPGPPMERGYPRLLHTTWAADGTGLSAAPASRINYFVVVIPHGPPMERGYPRLCISYPLGRRWNGAIRGSTSQIDYYNYYISYIMGRRWNGAIRGSASHTPWAADGTGLSAALHLISPGPPMERGYPRLYISYPLGRRWNGAIRGSPSKINCYNYYIVVVIFPPSQRLHRGFT
ncbi:uncharacterized protein EDB91DRAFT_1089152 [Suillus paluster]|uniref:uncharacterized protein n=1 Tax=Suillus paluster TaxID=48578 RepID=UPI001B87ED1D|nr:uncharacterized protein EDB91DRAFT_1089152 [Suillus paluster]KAG1719700.1 hypothetical protein EDB91DRAFT_1089152 [Suillus paluster]